MKKFGLFLLAVCVFLAPLPAISAQQATVNVTATITPVFQFSVDTNALDFGSWDPGTLGPTIGWRTAVATVACSPGATFTLSVGYDSQLDGPAAAQLGFDIVQPQGGVGNTAPNPNAVWNTGQELPGTCTGLSTPSNTGVNFGLRDIPANQAIGNYSDIVIITLNY